MATTKSPRRLPMLTIAPSAVSLGREFILSPETPEEYHTPVSGVDGDEKMAQDLALLEKLRRNVQMNLQLRPIGDGQTSPETDTPPASGVPFAPISSRTLGRRLGSTKRPLLIDTRNGGSYLASRIVGSVNIAIPSLILKRHRKPGGNFGSVHPLRAYVTTERGKDIWDALMRTDGASDGVWDGDIVVYDEEMDEHERDTAVSWILLALLEPVVRAAGRSALYLRGGITAFRQLPDSHRRVVSGERDLDAREDAVGQGAPSPKRGLSVLDVTRRPCDTLPHLDPCPSPTPPSLPPTFLSDHTPSPPPSAQIFHHRGSTPNLREPLPVAARPRKPSVPNLRRIDTTSAERLPKLSVRTQPVPVRAATLAVPPTAGGSSMCAVRLGSPRSPAHLTLRHIPAPPSPTASSPAGAEDEFYTPSSAFFGSASPGPSTPRAFSPPSPHTARPPPATSSPLPTFAISTILPNFLFLGPELTAPAHVAALHRLGVKRILNLAAECDPDDHGLRLRDEFERYVKIAMRDTVEEENIGRGVREVCECLDDARLHSSPTYVHCKAGKSRSVTAVMAYLIHANHWTLSRAYAFVLERRKGISPNIGFVSELMSFEERELGGKSVGVVVGGAHGAPGDDVPDGPGPGPGDKYLAHAAHARAGNYAHAAGMRRAAHMRESLPPAFTLSVSASSAPGATKDPSPALEPASPGPRGFPSSPSTLPDHSHPHYSPSASPAFTASPSYMYPADPIPHSPLHAIHSTPHPPGGEIARESTPRPPSPHQLDGGPSRPHHVPTPAPIWPHQQPPSHSHNSNTLLHLPATTTTYAKSPASTSHTKPPATTAPTATPTATATATNAILPTPTAPTTITTTTTTTPPTRTPTPHRHELPPLPPHELAHIGDHAQELEIKDSSGRYRHQRRAPVDETTLQPLRRVSKAGLESAWT